MLTHFIIVEWFIFLEKHHVVILTTLQCPSVYIVYKMTYFCCSCFFNKSKTTTWKKSRQKHDEFYGFCCCAYKNEQKIKSSFLFRMLGPCHHTIILHVAAAEGTSFHQKKLCHLLHATFQTLETLRFCLFVSP
jgi:hypothetical protein